MWDSILEILKRKAADGVDVRVMYDGTCEFLLLPRNYPKQLEAMGIQQSAQALNGLWIVFALIPTIGLLLAGILYMTYHLNDKDVQIMAKCNSGEITREEAQQQLSRKY